MSPKQGWLESDDDFSARIEQEANESIIEAATGDAPSQGWFESDDNYSSRIEQEANESTIEAATGDAPSQGWFESDDNYSSRIEQEANESTIEAATGDAPSQGWFESDDSYNTRVRKESNEGKITSTGEVKPRQGWFEGDYEYRKRINHDANTAEVRKNKQAATNSRHDRSSTFAGNTDPLSNYAGAVHTSRPASRPLKSKRATAGLLKTVALFLSLAIVSFVVADMWGKFSKTNGSVRLADQEIRALVSPEFSDGEIFVAFKDGSGTTLQIRRLGAELLLRNPENRKCKWELTASALKRNGSVLYIGDRNRGILNWFFEGVGLIASCTPRVQLELQKLGSQSVGVKVLLGNEVAGEGILN